MRKLSYLFVGAALVVALPLGANAARTRTVSDEYNTLTYSVSQDPPGSHGSFTNSVRFMPKAGERSVVIEVTDDHTDHVRAVVAQDLDGDGHSDVEFEICDRTDKPFRFEPGVEVQVWAQEGPCEDGTPAMATFGKVTATFTR